MGRFTTTTRRALAPAATVALVTAAVVAVLPAGIAASAIAATGSTTTTAASGSWAAVLVDSAGTDSLGQPISMSWTLFGSPVYVSVRNNGSLSLSGQTYTLTRSGGLGSFTATACIGATWNANGTCSTSNTRVLDTTASGSTAVSLALATNESVSIKVSAGVAALTTVNLSVGVARSQARIPTTTNN
ncbi:hypothetical protein G7043_26935 [Lentzea sp. NEAU-D13]|uniref:Uncharacterized protein n=1 Tax=Lentzea alba TaxID=2714351 RepID=A0A7C9VZ67_9PSEU|nr:hypothetical protein [Lentzea alba]NGY62561.1 hypothetical protein [Lentzea alba]